MGLDLRPPLDHALEAFGVAATVTRPAPDNTPISTTGFWLSERREVYPMGVELGRREPRRVFVLPRAALATLPRATTVAAAEYLGGAVKQWRVEGFDDVVEPDNWRAILVPA